MPKKPTAPAVPGPALTLRTCVDQMGHAAYEIEVDRITSDPDRPRTQFDPKALARLAMSMATHGQIQPITVRHADEPFHYVIVNGERRWRAAVLAGQEKIAAVILKGLTSPTDRLEIQLVENMVRQDLSPIEKARAFQTLMKHNGWSTRELAVFLQVPSGTISRALALLKRSEPVDSQADTGGMSPGAALEIVRSGEPANQLALARLVVGQYLKSGGDAGRGREMERPLLLGVSENAR